MVRTCLICKKRDDLNREVCFRSFTVNQEKRSLWLSIFDMENGPHIPRRPDICSDHFSPYEVVTRDDGRRHIKLDAIPLPNPSIFVDPSSSSSEYLNIVTNVGFPSIICDRSQDTLMAHGIESNQNDIFLPSPTVRIISVAGPLRESPNNLKKQWEKIPSSSSLSTETASESRLWTSDKFRFSNETTMEGKEPSKMDYVYKNRGFQLQETNRVNVNNSNESGTAYTTKEVFPRVENYRISNRTVRRPSLGELRGTEDYVKENSEENEISNEHSSSGHGVKLGWIQGVLIPCMLNIFGVMLFLRVSWIVAEAGIGLSLVIVLISTIVCILTTLSMSAICTNGEVKGGGIYYLISRSLGPEFGASVGIVFAFANAVSASMNTIGFCNSLSDLLKLYDIKIFDGDVNDARLVGSVAIIFLIGICMIGMEWESKAQNLLIAIIGGATIVFFVGVIIGPQTDEQRAQGFTGFNATVWQTNWKPDFRISEGRSYNFFQVFAIFFPSVTGIQAGANISGDLKNAASAIPKGTLLSLLITMTTYALFMLFTGSASIRDASGNISDLATGNLSDCVTDFSCEYGTFNNYRMITIMSAWWPFMYAGCWAACLSTALTNLFAVPRLIQALGHDEIYPGLLFFSKGYGKTGEPLRGYILTFLIAEGFLLIGDLNVIAPLISTFYLASYALINFCTFHAGVINPLGWRPTFKFYDTWLSFLGFASCLVIMFLINWLTSLITCTVILSLYLVVVYRDPDVNWGSSTQAQTYKSALSASLNLLKVGDHVKNYQPQVLVLCGLPKHRSSLLDFASLITKNRSLLVVGDITQEKVSHKTMKQTSKYAYAFLKANKIKGFYTLISNVDFESGAKSLLQTVGIGKLRPNILLIGYKERWNTCKAEDLLAYFNVLNAAFEHHFSLAILRTRGGLDHTSFIESNDITSSNNNVTANIHSNEPNLKLFNANASEVVVEDQENLNNSNSAAKLDFVPGTTKEEMHLKGVNQFRQKQGKGTIDVWWLYDSGGLTMLLPYIIFKRRDWSNCKLRVFALTSNPNDLQMEERNMEQLLTKFRLDYASLKMVSASEQPKQKTVSLFDSIIQPFRTDPNAPPEHKITDEDLSTYQEKTKRQLRLRELLLEHSKDAKLIVMSLPMPKKGSLSAPLYMSWLEILTKDMPPSLLVRGNQQSVLTFYS